MPKMIDYVGLLDINKREGILQKYLLKAYMYCTALHSNNLSSGVKQIGMLVSFHN